MNSGVFERFSVNKKNHRELMIPDEVIGNMPKSILRHWENDEG